MTWQIAAAIRRSDYVTNDYPTSSLGTEGCRD